MSILWTNWKSVALRWVVASPVVLLFGGIVIFLGAPVWVLVLFLLAYPVGRTGLVAVRLPREVAGKPFSFCLPGYRESLRKSSFLAASCVGLAAAPLGLVISWLAVYHHTASIPTASCLYILNGFSVGTAAVLCMGVDFRFLVPRAAWGFVLLLSIPLFFAGVLAVPAIVSHPSLGIPLSVAVAVFMWVRLGNMSRVGRGHRMILADILEARAQAPVARPPSARIEGVFLGAMQRRRALRVGRCIWGGLYRAFGPLLSSWRSQAVLLSGGVLALGYVDPLFTRLAFPALSAFVAVGTAPSLRSEMLVPEGRSEKFWSALTAAVVTSATLVVVASTLLLLSRLLAAVVPEIPWRDGSLRYVSIGPASVWLIALPVPWLLAACLSKLRTLRYVLVGIVGLSVMMTGLVVEDPNWFRGPPHGTWISFSGVLLCGWVVFCLRLRWACTRWDLVNQHDHTQL